jgi:uncharacterized protein (TIGR02246 family)
MADLDRDVGAVYRELLEAWNRRDASAYAALFSAAAHVIGFDGSQMDGRTAIEQELTRIFKDHPTGRYVGKPRGVEAIGEGVALLRAVAGIVPAGKDDLAPPLNAVQTLLARQEAGRWKILLFHTTPAQFHGRPEAVEALTAELRELLR